MKGSIVGLLIGIIMTGAIGMAMYRSADINSNFDFMLKYGYEGRSVINTYDDTYIKEGSTIIKMKLSNDEMETILNEMHEIDIFNYPEAFPVYGHVNLPMKQYLEVTYNGKKKTIAWSLDNMPPFGFDLDTYEDNEVLLLDRMANKIIRLIEAKDEYKKLQESRLNE
ncbi:hypothetical protein EHE19_009315 [Ruminiclostridium herbifermentans]|uniref:Uncharacterized protein n=1 Tax=Ruminiclostridium herbifermentans TaxID=2488810 RepID=A0A4U7JN98_9FIRM|nr:hypothetical protein [Ruminiclostridium herbifermentans]QNU68572.1 hypothetical protein EHE19_009315 [Ruminiclostridium herbifermentans]